jgi:hypothetical protein
MQKDLLFSNQLKSDIIRSFHLMKELNYLMELTCMDLIARKASRESNNKTALNKSIGNSCRPYLRIGLTT